MNRINRIPTCFAILIVSALAACGGGAGETDVAGDPDTLIPEPVPEPTPVPAPTPAPVDADHDGLADSVDNCQEHPNPEQGDIDNDNMGDACDRHVPIASDNDPANYVLADYRDGAIYYNGEMVVNAAVLTDMRRDFPIFDYDGLGIGNNRDCSVDHIDCTPTRDCTFSSIDCTPTRDCGSLTRNHDTRECRACIVGNIFTGGCSVWGNDPICEASKAAQNAIYDADYAARKLDCERTKSSEKLACEADKSARKLDCERIKTGDKLVCEADKSATKLDCERLKATQSAVGELWEAGIHEAKNQALSENPRPIPITVRRALQAYFDADLLDSVRWTDDHGNIFSWAKVATELSRRKAITLDNVIVFGSAADAMFDVGLWAHELEHVKQYRLLGIDAFAEYYADYFFAEFTAGFRAGYDFDPREVERYLESQTNKLEALASVQSAYVCGLIDPERTYLRYWGDGRTVSSAIAGTCRPN